jgi:hypothetical protein
MQSAQTARVLNGLQGFTDLAIMAMLKDSSMHLQDTQRRVGIIQAEIDRRIAAGDADLKKEMTGVSTPAAPAVGDPGK